MLPPYGQSIGRHILRGTTHAQDSPVSGRQLRIGCVGSSTAGIEITGTGWRVTQAGQNRSFARSSVGIAVKLWNEATPLDQEVRSGTQPTRRRRKISGKGSSG